jgi:Family of unknown function (DUF6065)
MKLVCYAVDRDPFPLRPAPVTREWMDRIPDHHAYRCLPLNIANSHGWEIASPCAFEVEWDGDPNVRGMAIRALDGYPDVSTVAVSHFAHGIVTFYLSYLFRTEPEWNLLATGPFNRPKDGIAPLTGIIETDWLPYPFTMNWQMTRRGKVRFEKDEPLCVVFPVRIRAVLDTHPEIATSRTNLRSRRRHLHGKSTETSSRSAFTHATQQPSKKLGSDTIFSESFPTEPMPAATHT